MKQFEYSTIQRLDQGTVYSQESRVIWSETNDKGGAWETFTTGLWKMATRNYHRKELVPLFSPACFDYPVSGECPRKKENVLSLGSWFICDIDDISSWQEYPAIDGIDSYEKFTWALKYFIDSSKYSYVCHSTGSCTIENIKFRLIFPLNRFVDAAEYPRLWSAMKNFLNYRFELVMDAQTKDISRFYHQPAMIGAPGILNFFIEETGPYEGTSTINVDKIIKEYSTEPASPESWNDITSKFLEKLNLYRVNYMDGSTHTWTSYRNCKFWPAKLAEKYQGLNSTGWYIMMYKIMCAIAIAAKQDNYSITPAEISSLVKEFDNDTGGWYKDRPVEREAVNAIKYAAENASQKIVHMNKIKLDIG